MSEELDRLDAVIDTMAAMLEGIPREEFSRPTPCPEFTVADLFDHLVGWVHVFEAAAHETDARRDPNAYLVDERHADVFRQAGHRAVTGLREKGVDRQVVMTSSPIPASMVVDMMTMEYPGHGWDLAVATGRPYPFDPDTVAAAHRAAERMIQPAYRGEGEGKFRPIVPTGPDAGEVDRFVAFLGRDPRWRSPAETNP